LKELISFIAEQLVDNPEAVVVQIKEEEGCFIVELSVAKDDLGKVIGKQGRTARAMRSVLSVSASRFGKRSRLEIIE
jgi:hypothetical protein